MCKVLNPHQLSVRFPSLSPILNRMHIFLWNLVLFHKLLVKLDSKPKFQSSKPRWGGLFASFSIRTGVSNFHKSNNRRLVESLESWNAVICRVISHRRRWNLLNLQLVCLWSNSGLYRRIEYPAAHRMRTRKTHWNRLLYAVLRLAVVPPRKAAVRNSVKIGHWIIKLTRTGSCLSSPQVKSGNKHNHS